MQAPVKAPESCTSLNKNLALHPALTVVDGWGGFGGFVFQRPKNAAKTPQINKRNRLPLSALRCHRDRLSTTILAPFLAVVVFTHGHFGFHKKRAASVCMILAISLEARPRAGAIKATQATQATDLMEGKGPATFGRPGSVVGPQRPLGHCSPAPRHHLPATTYPPPTDLSKSGSFAC